MIQRLKKAIERRNTTSLARIARDLGISPKARFFFTQKEAEDFQAKIEEAGDYIAVVRTHQIHQEEEVLFSVTTNAPEAIVAALNGDPAVMVIKHVGGAADGSDKFLFLDLADAEAHYGAYGFYFLNDEGQLEPYTEEDYVPENTIVYTKADENTPDAQAEKGCIKDFCMEVEYYLYGDMEIEMQTSNFIDVTDEWVKEYEVSSLLDLAFVGRKNVGRSEANWIEYYEAANAQGAPKVLFARERSIWVGADSEWLEEPITDEDDIASILKALEA